MSWTRRGLTLLGFATTVLAASQSAEGASRIDQIRETMTITIGHPEASVPFAFLGEGEKPVGYSVEICEQAVKLIAVKLGIKGLTIQYAPATSSTRIPLIQGGTIDLECGNTTNTQARKDLVSFSPTIFVSQIVLAARKASDVDVDELASFKGKTISAPSGGQNYKVVSELSAKNGYSITMAGAPDTSRAFDLMSSGRADAVASDDALLYAAVASTPNPDDFIVGGKGLEFAPYGIVLPKDDPQFKEVVDSAIKELLSNGTVEALYEKYFTSPIPPRGINLRYPMSDALKRAIKNPTDSSDPAAY